jgi:tRNA(Ile)-lysidine synthetase-like protein
MDASVPPSEACATLKLDVFRSKARELELRGWRAGDHYRPLGQSRDRKLKEMFQQRRVPSWRRPFWPILSMGTQIVWARGFGAAAEFAAGAPEVTDGVNRRVETVVASEVSAK